MSYRKLRADKIFDGYKYMYDRVVIVSKDGLIEDLVPVENAGDGVEFFNGILCPGFINCHCHLELSHMKGLIPEKTGLVDFVFKIITERHRSQEEILDAIDKAENQMLNAGIVAVGDICNNSMTIHQKQKKHLRYYNFIEASGWLPSVSKTRFERAKNLFDEFSSSNRQCSIVPHAPYSVSEDLWKEIEPYFENKVVTIHNQETAFEDEFFQTGEGDFTRMYEMIKIDNTHHEPTKKSSLKSYFTKLEKAKNAILVHNTFTTQADIDYIKLQTHPDSCRDKLHTFICLCVNANRFIEGTFPPIEMFRKNNCTIVLGTDSFASNWSLSILDEIKTIQKNFPSIPMEEILKWATSNGAQALQLHHELGSIEKGKKPGIVLINEDNLSGKRLV
jgi:aminodeoxyfutalosine deaminase